MAMVKVIWIRAFEYDRKAGDEPTFCARGLTFDEAKADLVAQFEIDCEEGSEEGRFIGCPLEWCASEDYFIEIETVITDEAVLIRELIKESNYSAIRKLKGGN
jgi:hypothetical protein